MSAAYRLGAGFGWHESPLKMDTEGNVLCDRPHGINDAINSARAFVVALCRTNTGSPQSGAGAGRLPPQARSGRSRLHSLS